MTSSGAHCHHLADSLCEPQSRAREDLSYKLIDTESPPYFVNTSRSLVYTTLGRTVILECRVRNLGNRAVSLVTDTPQLTLELAGVLDQTVGPAHSHRGGDVLHQQSQVHANSPPRLRRMEPQVCICCQSSRLSERLQDNQSRPE